MLTAQQVIGFLTHDHPAVRDQAITYFTHAADPGPVTAEDFWRAIDRFGFGDEGMAFLRRLADVPQTDASVDRLLSALDGESADERVRFELLLTLRDLDLPVLARHRERVLACPHLTPHLRGGLEARLALAEAPVDELWRRMLELSAAYEGKVFSEVDDGSAGRLIEALGHQGETAAARAMEYLRVPPGQDWAHYFSVEVLEVARYRPALDKLVRVFAAADEDDDAMHEACMRAIPAVGGADAADALAPLFVTENWTVRLYATGALGRVRHPSAEALMLRLLKDPKQEDVRDHLLASLAELCPTGEAFDVLYRRARDGDYDRQHVDLKEMMFALAEMNRVQVPELRQWRRHADKEWRRERQFREEMESTITGPEYRRRVLDGLPPMPSLFRTDEADDQGDQWEDEEDEEVAPARGAALPEPVDPYYPPVAATIRRDAPKVGRNDPCPCGSGKKYKKCCGG